MKLNLITSQQSINDLIEYLKDKDFIAYDTEATGVTQYDQIVGISVCAEESCAYYIILKIWDAQTSTLIDTGLDIQLLLHLLQTKQLIMHNAVFDCIITKSNFNVELIQAVHTDTMILAHLLNENRRVGLKELSVEYFGKDSIDEQEKMKESVLVNKGVWTKANKEMYKASPDLLAYYGAKDALLTYKLFMKLIPDLYEQNLDSFFYNDESMPLLRGPTYELNSTGLSVDSDAIQTLKKILEAECEEARAFIYKEITSSISKEYPGTSAKTSFNIESPSQLSWLLFMQMNLEFNILTKEGKTVCKALGLHLPYKPSAKREFITVCANNVGEYYELPAYKNNKQTRGKKIKNPWIYITADKKTLQKFSTKYKWISKLLDYKRKKKLLNTYIEGIQANTKYGVINPGFLQHGTTSGRYASRSPNFQNLPRDDQRIKDCIIARPGKVFVAADYSQLEPRVFAWYSKDSRLMAAFDGKSDFYSVVGIEVYDKHDALPLKDGNPDAFGIKYKKFRDLSKTIALAAAYGATAHQLAPTTGKSIDDTQEDIRKYFERFPGVKKMMLDAHELAKLNGFVLNAFGRPRRIPEAMTIPRLYGKSEHADLPYIARSLLNLACNHRIQSTGASIVNRAAIEFHNNCKKLGIKASLVLQVHDELIAECNEFDAKTVAEILQYSMETAVHLEGITFEAIPRITKTLAK